MAARQAPRLRAFACHQPRQIAGGAERPFVGDAHQVDTARGVFRLQLRQRRLDVDAVGHALGQRRLIDRLGGSKQQRFEKPQFLRPRRLIDSLVDGVILGIFHAFFRQACHNWVSFHLLDRHIRRGHRCLRRTLAKIQRRERLFLVQFHLTFSHQFECCGKA